jgi:hypothetical protein
LQEKQGDIESFKFCIISQMNKTYDYNGVQIAPSKPVQKLRTVKKSVHVDSGDRDTKLYPTSGDFVVYLPRVYENVLSIKIKQAEFPAVTSFFSYDRATGVTGGISPPYFFMEFEGLNRSDEGAPGADRSAFVDSVFAKFQVTSTTERLFYTESGGAEIIEYYRPAISKLDRVHVRVRTHGQNKNQHAYWSGNFSFSMELETMENSFDDFSSLETRIGERSGSGFFGC